jgi:hypothetical protein
MGSSGTKEIENSKNKEEKEMKEIEDIKRVLRWILLDRQIRALHASSPKETMEKWKKEYLWIIDYLEEKSGQVIGR